MFWNRIVDGNQLEALFDPGFVIIDFRSQYMPALYLWSFDKCRIRGNVSHVDVEQTFSQITFAKPSL